MPEASALTLPVTRHALDNGLTVVLQPDPSLPLVTVNLWYHVGSRNERPGRTGLAHLFEHMLFQGSANVDTNDHFRLIQQAGGVANGSTWFDRTNYYETLPAHYLDLALWLESDRMGFLLPALDEEKFENQRSVVMNERRERVDNQPYGRAFERLHEMLYPNSHPYHWPVIGYMDDIAAATLEDVESFFRTFYTPNNAVLTLAGDFEDARALDRIEHYFGSIPSGPPTPGGLEPPTVPNPEGREVMADQVRLARVYVAAAIPAFGTADWYAADLLSTVLGSGKSSPLYRDLVYTRQIATDVGCYVLPTELAATFVVMATAKPSTEVEDLESAVHGHLSAALAGPPARAELERARNKIVTSLYEQFQQLDHRADYLSMFTTYFDDPERIAREPEVYTGLEAEQLANVASRYLSPERRVSLAVVPDGKDAQP